MPAMSRVTRNLAACAAIALCACMDDGPGTPSAAVSRYVEALSQGDGAALYDLLRPEARADLDALHAALRTSAALVRERWPVAEQATLIDRLGAGLAERVEEPRAFLAALIGGGEPYRLGRMATWGARPMSATVSGESAQVSTLAGDTFDLIRADDTWIVVPPGDFDEALAHARQVAEANLARLRSTSERVRALEQGVVRTPP